MHRCQVESLSNEARWKIGNNELKNLRNMQSSKQIDQGTYEKRRTTIVDFISGISDRIDSDGVLVEFFVQ